MLETYAGHGVSFRYPHGWDVSAERNLRDVTISVSADTTSFWSLTLLFDRPDPEHAVRSAVETLREEYEELDSYDATDRVCGLPTFATDIEFICLELTNSAFLRAFRTDEFTAFVYYQGTDRDLDEDRAVLEAISSSLACVADEPPAASDG